MTPSIFTRCRQIVIAAALAFAFILGQSSLSMAQYSDAEYERPRKKKPKIKIPIGVVIGIGQAIQKSQSQRPKVTKKKPRRPKKVTKRPKKKKVAKKKPVKKKVAKKKTKKRVAKKRVTKKVKPVRVANYSSKRSCLPSDLYSLMRKTYGKRRSLARCDITCLPKPEGVENKTLVRLASTYGVKFCKQCIELNSYLSLDDIQKLEKLTKKQFCPKAENRCTVPDLMASGGSVTKVRNYVQHLSSYGATSTGDELAVIVGNSTYRNALPDKMSASYNAKAVKTLLKEQLGYASKNIIDLRNASLGDLERIFGSDEAPEGRLKKMLEERGASDVFVYVSSHGFTDPATGQSVILPIDADMQRFEETTYPVQKLYKRLGELGADQTTVVLEADFAERLDPTGQITTPPNFPQKDVGVLPAKPVPGLVVMTASDRDQHALVDGEYGLGLFTRYFVEGMAGKADQAPIGNGDARIDTVELFVYTSHMVRMAARKTLGLEQRPVLNKSDNIVVSRLGG